MKSQLPSKYPWKSFCEPLVEDPCSTGTTLIFKMFGRTGTMWNC